MEFSKNGLWEFSCLFKNLSSSPRPEKETKYEISIYLASNKQTPLLPSKDCSLQRKKIIQLQLTTDSTSLEEASKGLYLCNENL